MPRADKQIFLEWMTVDCVGRGGRASFGLNAGGRVMGSERGTLPEMFRVKVKTLQTRFVSNKITWLHVFNLTYTCIEKQFLPITPYIVWYKLLFDGTQAWSKHTQTQKFPDRIVCEKWFSFTSTKSAMADENMSQTSDKQVTVKHRKTIIWLWVSKIWFSTCCIAIDFICTPKYTQNIVSTTTKIN